MYRACAMSHASPDFVDNRENPPARCKRGPHPPSVSLLRTQVQRGRGRASHSVICSQYGSRQKLLIDLSLCASMSTERIGIDVPFGVLVGGIVLLVLSFVYTVYVGMFIAGLLSWVHWPY